jgi:hypothetical protein
MIDNDLSIIHRDIIDEYDKNMEKAHLEILRVMKEKIQEIELRDKIVEILTDKNKEGRNRIIKVLESKKK